MPTYRRPDQLSACLQALLEQNLPHDEFEVIVVDDGSGAPPRSVLTAFPGLQLQLLEERHGGPAAARNLGAMRSKGRLLAFTDDDCTPTRMWLAELNTAAESAPDCLLGGRTVNLMSGNPQSAASQGLIDYLYAYYNKDAHHARFFASNNICVPRDGFLDVGGFDPSMVRAGGEDREFCDRWLQSGRCMVSVPAAVIRHAHPLTLRDFARQHFTYGRGAYWFRQARARRGGVPISVEPIGFYLGMLRAGLRAPGGFGDLQLVALLGLSQVANAAGFCYESCRPHTQAASEWPDTHHVATGSDEANPSRGNDD